jgi:MFS transporter, SHS family, lactate transporter
MHNWNLSLTVAMKAAGAIPWWREPTREQWHAWVAAWLGWTLDAFDFTIFLLIMAPVASEFGVPLTAVAIAFTITLWLRLVGAVASGWLADRIGRKAPLMISILWYSICNFIAGFSPNFTFLLVCRALLGIGMGAEWPAGVALAMESWPARSRGFMSGLLQGSWAFGFFLSSAAYGLLYHAVGWRGLLWIGVLPALAVVYVRYFVREPECWVVNRRNQRLQGREMRFPLFAIFRRGLIANTLTACWWIASSFVVYYSMWALFATHLQNDLNLAPAEVATPIALANLAGLLGTGLWGWASDLIGRRWAMIIPATIGVLIAPAYLLSADYTWVATGFVIQGLFLGAIDSQNPSYLAERFPTEVRATASAFCYHQGAIVGGLTAPALTYFANTRNLGFALPMLIGTCLGGASFVLALLVGPETKGREFAADLELA